MRLLDHALASLIVILLVVAAPAPSQNPINGFRAHGVATPVINHRGPVATVDGNGRNIVLVWLFDRRAATPCCSSTPG